jgi:dolichol-phosphate mannosyltransferase
MVKCGCERVVEVPIHFEDRRYGESKLNLMQQLLYLLHLRRLYIFKYGVWSQLTQFLIVGGLGTGVNLGGLTLLIAAGIPTRIAIATAILLSMGFNFALNRRFSFADARRGSLFKQLARYAAATSVGGIINYATTLFALARLPGIRPQVGALIGIAMGTTFNFVASRYLVFRVAHIRTATPTE